MYKLYIHVFGLNILYSEAIKSYEGIKKKEKLIISEL